MHVQFSDFRGSSPYTVDIDREPDTCPRCHRSVHPKFYGGYAIPSKGIGQLTYRCTHHECNEVFIANYAIPNFEAGKLSQGIFLTAVPKNPAKSSFPQTIIDCSTTFVEIYDQALTAESYELDQIVGIGMRKALEFLIKDYASLEHPEKSENIKKTMLGKCIDDYILDTNVKACAKRAAWLGNDETHYVRKWTGQDINDLKMLIKLTVNWIDNSLTTKNYLNSMPDPAA